MFKDNVIEFFDRCAPNWDATMIRNDEIINRILDLGGICAGAHVLDVASGTGVLVPDYLARNVASLTTIDISPEMVAIARQKFADQPVTILCGDVETAEFDRLFDAVMVYNAFPHFPEPEKLLARLAALVKPGGRVSVAHGMSRAAIDAHHHGPAAKVSVGLMHENDLAALMAPWFDVDVIVSNESMYQVSGRKR